MDFAHGTSTQHEFRDEFRDETSPPPLSESSGKCCCGICVISCALALNRRLIGAILRDKKKASREDSRGLEISKRIGFKKWQVTGPS